MSDTVSEPKTKSHHSNIPVKLKLRWGTFCKSIAQEPGTNETTLIGVLPALQIAAQLMPGASDKSIFLPIPLWLHVNIVSTNSSSEPTHVEIEMSLSINKQIHKEKIPVYVGPAETSSVLNMKVITPNGIPLKTGLQTLIAAFVYNGEEIGEIELPITVAIATAQNIPQVNP